MSALFSIMMFGESIGCKRQVETSKFWQFISIVFWQLRTSSFWQLKTITFLHVAHGLSPVGYIYYYCSLINTSGKNSSKIGL